MRARDKKCGWTILVGSVLMATAACALANSQATVALAQDVSSSNQEISSISEVVETDVLYVDNIEEFTVANSIVMDGNVESPSR